MLENKHIGSHSNHCVVEKLDGWQWQVVLAPVPQIYIIDSICYHSVLLPYNVQHHELINYIIWSFPAALIPIKTNYVHDSVVIVDDDELFKVFRLQSKGVSLPRNICYLPDQRLLTWPKHYYDNIVNTGLSFLGLYFCITGL